VLHLSPGFGEPHDSKPANKTTSTDSFFIGPKILVSLRTSQTLTQKNLRRLFNDHRLCDSVVHCVAIHSSLNTTKASIPADQQLSYQAVYEALFLRAFRDRMTPGLSRELLEIGLDFNALKPTYPYSYFVKSLELIAKHLFPNESLESSVPKIGERLVTSYFETLLGKPLLALLRVLRPVRGLHRMKQNFRASNNFSESQLVELSPHSFQLWLNEPGLPGLSTLGVLRKGLTLAGSSQVKVTILATDALGTVYDIEV
jgi:uncharacterized protein (TIGR02265 family)